jgi:CheY-like chemotaxis protein
MPVIRSIRRYLGKSHPTLLGSRVVVSAVVRGGKSLQQDAEVGELRPDDRFEVRKILGTGASEKLSLMAYEAASTAFEETGQHWSKPLAAPTGIIFEPPARAPGSAAAAAEEDSGREESPVAADRMRVLVVDDNKDSADSLRLLIGLLGVVARVAYDGETALRTIAEFRPAAVILDLGMPGMDGWEVARRIRSGTGGKEVTLIALTGWSQPQDRRRSAEAGFDHHLIKPVDLAVLQSVLVPNGVNR